MSSSGWGILGGGGRGVDEGARGGGGSVGGLLTGNRAQATQPILLPATTDRSSQIRQCENAK